MRRFAVLMVAVILACSPSGERRLKNVSISSASFSSTTAPARSVYTYSATLPGGIDLAAEKAFAVGFDREGKQHKAQKMSFSESGEKLRTFSATFELPEGVTLERMVIGRYSVDVHRGVIVDTKAPR